MKDARESTVVCPALGRRHGRPSSPERRNEEEEDGKEEGGAGEKEEGVRWLIYKRGRARLVC